MMIRPTTSMEERKASTLEHKDENKRTLRSSTSRGGSERFASRALRRRYVMEDTVARCFAIQQFDHLGAPFVPPQHTRALSNSRTLEMAPAFRVPCPALVQGLHSNVSAASPGPTLCESPAAHRRATVRRGARRRHQPAALRGRHHHSAFAAHKSPLSTAPSQLTHRLAA